jgi:hypothetical protein
MGKALVAFLLGTALIALSFSIFGQGVMTSFLKVSAEATSPSHMMDLAMGRADPSADVVNIILFISEIIMYYLVAAILVFVFDLFMPNKEKK